MFTLCTVSEYIYNFRKIFTVEIDFFSLYPEILRIYDIENDFWQAEELNRGRGLLSIMGAIFLIDYENFQNQSQIEFIPYDMNMSLFQWENRIVRNSDFSISNQDDEHMMFTKPVNFLLRNFKQKSQVIF